MKTHQLKAYAIDILYELHDEMKKEEKTRRFRAYLKRCIKQVDQALTKEDVMMLVKQVSGMYGARLRERLKEIMKDHKHRSNHWKALK